MKQVIVDRDGATSPQGYNFVLAIADDDGEELLTPVHHQRVLTPSARQAAPRMPLSPAARHHPVASYRNRRKMSRVAASFPNGSMSTILVGSRDGSSCHQLGPQDLEWLLASKGQWQLQYANEALEGEFATFFHRSRLPSQYWVGLQMVLIVGIMATAGPTSRVVLGLLLVALLAMVVAIVVYGYLRAERTRLAKVHRESKRSATSTINSLNTGNNGEYPDVWFRADTLIVQNDASRNKLRRNAVHHERVTWLLVAAYCMMFAAFIFAKGACGSEASMRTCANAIQFESSFLVFQMIVVIVIPQRMTSIVPSLLSTLVFAMVVRWLPFMPSVVYAAYWTTLALFTNSTMLLLVCCYYLERRKRYAFGEVVWHCVIAQRSEVLRQQVKRMTKAAFPFDLDAFLWQQHSPLLPPPTSRTVGPAAAASASGSSTSAAVNRLVFAESCDGAVAVLKVRGFTKWCAAMSPSDVVRSLQDVFSIFERMISATHRTPTFGAASFGHSAAGSFTSIDETSSGRTDTFGSDVVVLSVQPHEQLYKATFGDSFLVMVLPSKTSVGSTSQDNHHHNSNNNNINSGDGAAANPLLQPSSTSSTSGAPCPPQATAPILHRMVAFCVSCIAKAAQAVEAAAQQDNNGLPRHAPPPPLVDAVIATGDVCAAATGGARGVHVYFSGAAVDAALSPRPPSPSPSPPRHEAQQRHGGGDLRGGVETSGAGNIEATREALCVVVQTSKEADAVAAAIVALGGDVELAHSPPLSSRHRSAFTVPYPCIMTSLFSGTPREERGGAEDRPTGGGVVRSSRRPSGAFSASTGSSGSRKYTIRGTLYRHANGSTGVDHQRTHLVKQQQPSPALLTVDVPHRGRQQATVIRQRGQDERLRDPTTRSIRAASSASNAPVTVADGTTTCSRRIVSVLCSAVHYVSYRPFDDDALESQYLSEARAFHRERLLLLAVCGMCTGLVMAGIAAIGLVQDDVDGASIISSNPRESELIWFALCVLWAIVIFLLGSFFGAAASRPPYYILFLLYAGCYCAGIFVSSEGTVIYNSPTAWLFPIVGLSLLRPTWEGPGAASIPDIVLVIVFFVRERTMVPSATRVGQAAAVQIAVNIAQFVAVRMIQERMERSFFATRAESAAYSVQVEDHVHTLDDILRTIAPDKRIARELARALQKAVEAQQERLTSSGVVIGGGGGSVQMDEHGNLIPLELMRVEPEYVHDTVIAAAVHDTPFLMVRLSPIKASSAVVPTSNDGAPAAIVATARFHDCKALLHDILQSFVASIVENTAANALNLSVADRSAETVFFVQDPLGTLGATVVCNQSGHLLSLLHVIERKMQSTQYPVVTAVLGCGTHIGAVIGGGRREDGVGAARFDIYGGAVASHRALLMRIEDGSVVATARFRLYTSKDGTEAAAFGEGDNDNRPRRSNTHNRISALRQRLAEGTALPFFVDGVSLHGVFV